MGGGLKIRKERSLPPIFHPSSGLEAELAIKIRLCADSRFSFKMVLLPLSPYANFLPPVWAHPAAYSPREKTQRDLQCWLGMEGQKAVAPSSIPELWGSLGRLLGGGITRQRRGISQTENGKDPGQAWKLCHFWETTEGEVWLVLKRKCKGIRFGVILQAKVNV